LSQRSHKRSHSHIHSHSHSHTRTHGHSRTRTRTHSRSRSLRKSPPRSTGTERRPARQKGPAVAAILLGLVIAEAEAAARRLDASTTAAAVVVVDVGASVVGVVVDEAYHHPCRPSCVVGEAAFLRSYCDQLLRPAAVVVACSPGYRSPPTTWEKKSRGGDERKISCSSHDDGGASVSRIRWPLHRCFGSSTRKNKKKKGIVGVHSRA